MRSNASETEANLIRVSRSSQERHSTKHSYVSFRSRKETDGFPNRISNFLVRFNHTEVVR